MMAVPPDGLHIGRRSNSGPWHGRYGGSLGRCQRDERNRRGHYSK